MSPEVFFIYFVFRRFRLDSLRWVVRVLLRNVAYHWCHIGLGEMSNRDEECGMACTVPCELTCLL